MLHAIGRALSAFLLLANLAVAADADYDAEIQKWRQDFDADVRNGGWLPLIGRFKIEEGISTIGSDPSAVVRLPPTLSTQKLGTLTRHADQFRFTPKTGIDATVDGHPLAQSTMLMTKPGSGRIQVGNLRFSVRAIGDDFYLLASDSQNPAVQQFTGTT